MEISFEYIASLLLLNKLMNYGVRIVRKFAVIQFFFICGGGSTDSEVMYILYLILKTML